MGPIISVPFLVRKYVHTVIQKYSNEAQPYTDYCIYRFYSSRTLCIAKGPARTSSDSEVVCWRLQQLQWMVGKKLDHQLPSISILSRNSICIRSTPRLWMYRLVKIEYLIKVQKKILSFIYMNLPYVIQRSSSGKHLPTLPLTNSQHGARRPDVTDLSTSRRFHLSGLATAPPALRGASRRTTEISCGSKGRKT